MDKELYFKEKMANQKIELMNVRSLSSSRKPLQPGALIIEGILYDPSGKSFVSINGNVVSEGDVSGDIAVKKINPNSVEVKGEDKIIEVQEQ